MTKKHIVFNALHSKAGGGKVYVQNLLPHLTKDKNFKWTVVAPQEALEGLNLPEYVQTLVTPSFPSFITANLYEQFILPFKLKEIGYDTLICCANYVPFLAKNTVPILINNCDVYNFTTGGFLKAYWWVMRYLTDFSIRKARTVFSVSKALYESYVQTSPKGKFYHTPPASVIAPAGGKRKKATLLAVGDAYLQKNYVSLIKAFAFIAKHNKDAELLIVGRYPFAAIERQIKATVYALGLKNKVHLLGAVPYEEVLKLYQTCTLYVSTSDAEAFSLTLLEAMGAGCPCLVKDTAFNREVGQKNVAYVATGQNFEEQFAHDALVLLTQANKQKELGQKAKTHAKTFSWEKTAKTMLKALK